MSLKTLVTGASGFIGSNLCNFLNDKTVIRCDTKQSFGVWPPDEIDIHFQDIECVYHLGAISSTTETNTEKIAKNNILFSTYLLEKCISLDIPFVYASSASVYGLGDRGFFENTTTTPLNYYAISKSTLDSIVLQKIKDNPDKTIVGLRYFNVYGPGESHKGDMASPVHKFLRQSSISGKIKVFEGSDQFKRDFIHVDDVVSITRDAKQFPSGIYNVGTGVPRSFLEVAEIISSLTGAEIQEIDFPSHLVGKYQSFTCSDNTKINNLGYTLKRISLEDGIKKIYDSCIF